MKMKITEHHGFDLIDFKIILIISKINRLVYLITIDRLLIILDWCHSDWEYKNMQIRAQNDPLTYFKKVIVSIFYKKWKEEPRELQAQWSANLHFRFDNYSWSHYTVQNCTHDVHLLLNTK